MEYAGTNFFRDHPVLLVNPLFKRLFANGIERQEIEIVVGAAVKNAAAAIHDGVDQSVRGAAVLGLKVIDRLADFDICVMPEEHIRRIHFPRGALAENSSDMGHRYFLVPFDRLACEWIL
jgi:hypothetical protein